MLSPYAKADKDKLDEIIREAELLLDAQTALATAADQRALTFAGLLVAAVAALVGAALAAHPQSLPVVSLSAIAAGLLVASALSLWSARPVNWYPAGNRPGAWLEDIEEGDSLHNGRAAMAEYYEQMISRNEERITAAGRLMHWSFGITAATLAVAAIYAVAATF